MLISWEDMTLDEAEEKEREDWKRGIKYECWEKDLSLFTSSCTLGT